MALRRTAFDAVLTPDSFALNHDGAATSESSVTNLRGSKRGACDRCRGQKLRCLRKDPSRDTLQTICARCLKAGATCSFRTPKRTGRPRAKFSHSPRHGEPKEGGKASRPTVNTSGNNGIFDSKTHGGQSRREIGSWDSGRLWEENAADQENEGETKDMMPEHAPSPSSLHDTSNVLGGVNFDFPVFSEFPSTATLPWPDETMPSFYNDAGEASNLESFGAKYSRAFHTYEAQPMGIQIPYASPISNDGISRDKSGNACGTPTLTYSTAQISGASDEAMDLDLPSENVYTTPVDPKHALNVPPSLVRDRDRERARFSASFGKSSTTTSALFNNVAENEVGINSDEETLSANEIQHRRMQELSELAMDLYAQLAAYDPQIHQPTSSTTSIVFQQRLEDTIGSVLKSSKTFLTLLTSYSTPTAPSSPLFSSRPTVATNHNNSPCSSSGSSVSPSASTLDHDDHAGNEPAQHFLRTLPAGSSDDTKPPPPIDMATVLQLLTCYMHIIHLHSVMHERILDYMLPFLPHTTQHVDSVPPIFPGMQVGGVSLDKFGTFQVKLLLKISVHVLEEIEMALGLPKEYSVGNRKGDGRGVLEASVSGAFVKCLMREEAWRGKRVECVKERLENLRRVLRGATDL
ncbi:MAG: hypothetical protein Q9161_006476 [Pseudevernia consocians]